MCCCGVNSKPVATVEFESELNSLDRKPLCNANVTGWTRHAWSGLQWALPVATVVLIPKCPACVAAIVLLFTGVSLSIPAAGALRWILIGVSLVALVWCLLRRVHRFARRRLPLSRRLAGHSTFHADTEIEC